MRFFDNYKDRLIAIMSERKDGNMKINHDGEKSTNGNRRNYFEKNEINENSVVSGLLHHGNKVVIVRDLNNLFIPRTDALVTAEKGIHLSVTNADCYPIFFFDSIGEVIAIAHAGWKGIVNNIIPNTIGKMILEGADVRNTEFIIGPGLCKNCFEFHVQDAKLSLGRYYDNKYFFHLTKEKVCIDFTRIIFDQLCQIGAFPEKIIISKECTHCDEVRFFSSRKIRGEDLSKLTDSMVSVIGMKA